MPRKFSAAHRDDDRSKSKRRRQTGSTPAGRRPAGKILSSQECLVGMSQLPGMLTLGFMKPAQANAVRAAYRDILDCLERASQAGSTAPLSNDDVLGILRKNPELLNSLGPLLTDEQFELVRQEIAEDEEQEEEYEADQGEDEEQAEDQSQEQGADGDG